MENQKKINENEELSIIDLLTVVIKYRKLIIIGTIIPVVFAALWFYVAKPKLKPLPAPTTNVKAVYTIRFNYMPQKLVEGIGQNFNRWWDWNGRMIFDFVNPTIAGPLYEKNQFAGAVAEGQGEGYLKPFIDSKAILCENSLDTTYKITISMPSVNTEILDAYIKSFIEYEHNLINEKYLENNIAVLEERCNRMLKEVESANAKTVNFEEITKAKNILEDIEVYKRNKKPFYEIQGKPVIETTINYPATPNNTKKMLIVIVGSFFIFIFIAFVLNAIQNIKADPESSKKIKDAWDSGKIRK